ncbi:MAG: TolC family protein [Nitrospiraceae bacterium]
MVIGILAFTAVPAIGQEPRAGSAEVLSLPQALDLALQNNRPAKIAELDAGRAGDQVAIARTRRLPSLNVFALSSQLLTPLTFTIDTGALGTFPGTGPIPSNTAKLTTDPRWFTIFYGGVTQPLTQLLRINEGIAAREASQEIATEEFRSQRHSVANEVKRAYFAVLQVQSAMEAAEEAIKTSRELERVVRQRVEQQKALKADLLDVKSRLARAEYDALALGNALATRKEQLNVILGREVDTEFRVTMVPIPPPPETDLGGATTDALKNRPDVKAARLRITQAERDLSAKKAEYIPDVSLAFNYLYLGDLNFLPTHVAMVGFQLNWEPFDWGRKHREVVEKRRAIQQASLGVKESEARTIVEVNDRYRKVQESYTLLQVTTMAQEATREKLRVTMNRYEQQATLLQDVLQAQASLADTNNQTYQALLSFWTAKADLEKAVGDERP